MEVPVGGRAMNVMRLVRHTARRIVGSRPGGFLGIFHEAFVGKVGTGSSSQPAVSPQPLRDDPTQAVGGAKVRLDMLAVGTRSIWLAKSLRRWVLPE